MQRVEDDRREGRICERQREVRRLVAIDVAVQRAGMVDGRGAAEVDVQVDKVRAAGRKVCPAQPRRDADDEQRRRRLKKARAPPGSGSRRGGRGGVYPPDFSDPGDARVTARAGRSPAATTTAAEAEAAVAWAAPAEVAAGPQVAEVAEAEPAGAAAEAPRAAEAAAPRVAGALTPPAGAPPAAAATVAVVDAAPVLVAEVRRSARAVTASAHPAAWVPESAAGRSG